MISGKFANLTILLTCLCLSACHENHGSTPANLAASSCSAGSLPEPALQGQVPLSDRESGRSAQGYHCNLELVSQYQGEGSSWVSPSSRHCAYLSTSFLGTLTKSSPGVQVVDVSDPTNPVLSDTLTSPAMLIGPWESLKVNEKRGLLGAVAVGPVFGGLYFDVYDVATDCRHPVHLNGLSSPLLELPSNTLGHEGNWSPDGNTYWATGLAGGSITAIDVTDPANPRVIYTGLAGFPVNHGVEFSNDGNRMYLATLFPGGVMILDISDIQSRKPTPQIRELGRASWNDSSAAQHALPVSYDGHPYLLVADEFSSQAVHIVDIADETRPQVTGQIRLEIHRPEHQQKRVEDTAGNGLFSYEAHYCNVDRQENPTALACGFFNSGIRVFDIREIHSPREIAYFNPPAQIGKTFSLPGSEHAAGFTLSPSFGELSALQYNVGTYILNLAQGRDSNLSADWCSSPPRFVGNQLWVTCQDNGFMVLRFTNNAYPLN